MHTSPPNLSTAASEAVTRLADFFSRYKSVIIAFSGGMDSSMLALAAQRFASQNYLAILVNSEFMTAEELCIARTTAAKHNLHMKEICLQVLNEPLVTENSCKRCYYCKKLVFSQLLAEAASGQIICDGSVTDDDTDYRPGKIAIKELNVKSPLHECGFSKALVAEILTAWGADELIRPAQSCLATRITTGSKITSLKLQQIEAGEKLLHQAGLGYCRLRHHDEVARIEVEAGDRHRALDIVQGISDQLKSLGFKHICIDVTGYQKGSMNQKQD